MLIKVKRMYFIPYIPVFETDIESASSFSEGKSVPTMKRTPQRVV
jgi:hypothetical protein